MVKQSNVIVDKSYSFSIQIIELYKYLIDEKKEFVISKQILRCGTSIGANINEAQSAESKSDFIHKFSISAKEARETEYWLKLLKDSNYINEDLYVSNVNVCKDILRIINSIILTTKGKTY